MHNRESAEASSPELARAPLPALLVSGDFPSRTPAPPPPSLISTPSWRGERSGGGVGGPGPRGEVGLGAERVTEHPSRCPSPRCCPAGAAGAPRGTPGGVCVWGGGGIAPQRAACRSVALPHRGPHPAGGYDPAPKFGGEARRGGKPRSGPPPGRGCRRRWEGGRGTQGLTAPRPGGAVKVHGLQMLFRPRCLPF